MQCAPRCWSRQPVEAMSTEEGDPTPPCPTAPAPGASLPGGQGPQLKPAQDEDSRCPERSRGSCTPCMARCVPHASLGFCGGHTSFLASNEPSLSPSRRALHSARPRLGPDPWALAAHTPQTLRPFVPVLQHAGTLPLQEGASSSRILASPAPSDTRLALKTSVRNQTGRRWQWPVSLHAAAVCGPGPSRAPARQVAALTFLPGLLSRAHASGFWRKTETGN